MIYQAQLIIFLTIFINQLVGCKKYLNEPSSSKEAIPRTLKDLQAILNTPLNINQQACTLAEIAADDYYVTTDGWQAASSYSHPSIVAEAYNYIWDGNPFGPTINNSSQWEPTYVGPIVFANIVLDILPTITRDDENSQSWDQVKGEALFYRAFNFHSLAQVYCRPFSSTASTDPGIVLRLDGNISATYTRASVEATYDQIIADLKLAASLLPVKSLYLASPNKAAAYAMLARTYLSMREYEQAGYYAEQSLKQYSVLLDYNMLVPVKIPAIPPFNREILFFNTSVFGQIYRSSALSSRVDSILYKSYHTDDLRKLLFFRPQGTAHRWMGSYASNVEQAIVFNGLATDEIYLIHAESLVWADRIVEAMQSLNTLLVKRWRKDSFTALTAGSKDDALALIRAERRKELCFRGLRWSDLRRYNLEGANITLRRVVAGKTYTLPPNDPRWVMLIPLDEINRSGIEQNPR